MREKQKTIWRAVCSLVASGIVGFFIVQAEVALRPGTWGTFDVTRRIAYGYHNADSANHCGNGSVEAAQQETCDPEAPGAPANCRVRNTTGNTACTNECCGYCGDGNIDNSGGGETCDDNDADGGDGCSSGCAVEFGFSCSGEPSSCSSSCGDGRKASDESCDDGDTDNSDGCSSTCTVESGWSCTGTDPSSCVTTCGDSIVVGAEECDDGNTSNNDACAQCNDAACGDGYVQTDVEECDDGNASNTDTCSTSCIQSTCGDGVVQTDVEECDYTIAGVTDCNTQCRVVRSIGGGGTAGGGGGTLPPPERNGPPPPCGNGIVEKEKGEECDNGRFNGVTGCSDECKMFICGDGIISPHLNEECEVEFEEEVTEAGMRYWYVSPACGISCTLPQCIGNSCSGGCRREVLPACGGDRTPRRSLAPAPVGKIGTTVSRPGQRPPPPAHCGNGVHEPAKGEECDLGSYNGVSGCSLWCEVLYCGDGEISIPIGEECEPKRAVNGAFIVRTCGTTCTVPVCDAKGTCSGGCRIRFLDQCLFGEGEKKTSMPLSLEPFLEEEPSVSAFKPGAPARRPEPMCGNNRIEGDEECDDGNLTNGDGCSSRCALEEDARDKCGDGVLEQWEECDNGEFNSDTEPNACRKSCRMSHCSDRVIDANEQCDDGNTIDGDGCSSQCFKADCGNNVLEIGEGCDQGAMNSDTLPNSCRSDCRMPFCGDGVVDMALGERCDDGEENSDTAPNRCRLDCWPSGCGDGVTDKGEQCDDGNRVDMDVCRNDCTLPICGDGVRQGNEQCDDGNRLSGDECSARCQREVRVDPGIFGVGLIVFIVSAVIEWMLRKKTLSGL